MGLNTNWKSIHFGVVVQLLFFSVTGGLLQSQTNLKSADGYVRREGNEWILGTSRVERRVRLANGRFVLASLRNKISGREYQDATAAPAEIRFVADGQDVSASTWSWKLRGEHSVR